ncbi:MAG TPA: hypothetical protein VFN10_12590 [Thermoanaerobaculia bacterium]|jgi:hypothetical protein|nr:hypothetical protein [Thermoanaerobaculia bacterium]
MATRFPDQHERSAAGMDFENDPVRERAAQLGAKVAENGPEALLDEIENLLPEAWRDQIRSFPVAAVILGVGVGVWLGMKKSDEIIAAGTSLVSAAAMANVSQVMDKVKQG